MACQQKNKGRNNFNFLNDKAPWNHVSQSWRRPARHILDVSLLQKVKKKHLPKEDSFNDLPSIRCLLLLLLLLLLRILSISSCLHTLAICCGSSSIAAHLQPNKHTISIVKKKKAQMIASCNGVCHQATALLALKIIKIKEPLMHF